MSGTDRRGAWAAVGHEGESDAREGAKTAKGKDGGEKTG